MTAPLAPVRDHLPEPRFLQTWLPVLVLGTLVMILSELSVWNLGLFMRALSRGPLPALLLLLGVNLLYCWVVALFLDLVLRFRLRDTTGLLLLGSLYGLVMEGLLAPRIFGPGFGPVLASVPLLNFTFTALSVHPLVPFLGAFTLLPFLLRGGAPTARHALPALLVWFSLAYAPWSPVGGAAPLLLLAQLLALGYGALALGLLRHLTLTRTGGGALPPRQIFTDRTWLLAAVPLAVAAIAWALHLTRQGRPWAFPLFLTVALAHAILLALHLRARQSPPATSAYDDAFPPTADPAPGSFARGALLLGLALVGFRLLVDGLHLQALPRALSLLFCGACILYAVAFPLVVLLRLVLPPARDGPPCGG